MNYVVHFNLTIESALFPNNSSVSGLIMRIRIGYFRKVSRDEYFGICAKGWDFFFFSFRRMLYFMHQNSSYVLE
jgi:hypothetical protein